MSRYSKVYIAETKNIGRGIFAKIDIPTGGKVFVFRGTLVRESYDSSYKIGSRWVGVGRCLWIDVLPVNPGYYINHSCRPNAGFKGKATLVAIRKIKKGEEITFDYSTTEEDPNWRMSCRCGAKECRKIIRGVQFLPEKVFRRRRSFTPKFFRDLRVKSLIK